MTNISLHSLKIYSLIHQINIRQAGYSSDTVIIAEKANLTNANNGEHLPHKNLYNVDTNLY